MKSYFTAISLHQISYLPIFATHARGEWADKVTTDSFAFRTVPSSHVFHIERESGEDDSNETC